jgi:uncharacterized protein YihD (DUF1040 family)
MMRDIARIRVLLEELELTWRKNPDLRLCQFIYAIVKPNESCLALFYMEDEMFIKLIRSMDEMLDNIQD